MIAYADSMVINEITLDLIIQHVESYVGDVVLIAPDSFLDGSGAGKAMQDALDALKALRLALTLAESAEARYLVLEKIAAYLEAELAKAVLAGTATPAMTAEAASARAAADAARADALAARALATAAQANASAKQTAALAMGAAVVTPAHLYLYAGKTVGTATIPLSVAVDGSIYVEAPDGIYLAGYGDLVLDDLITDVAIAVVATGNIELSTHYITAPEIELSSLFGNVGAEDKFLLLVTDHLSGYAGDGFYVEGASSLVIGTISAPIIELIAHGDLTSDGTSTVNIIADRAYLQADGIVGSYTNPIITDVDTRLVVVAGSDISVSDLSDLTMVANSATGQVNAEVVGSLNLSNSNGRDLVIGVVVAGDVATISSQANLVAGNSHGNPATVTAISIVLDAAGDIARAGMPLNIDTHAEWGGWLMAEARNVYVNEVAGDVAALLVKSTVGDVVITAPDGSILDATGNGAILQDAYDALKAANIARVEAELAESQALILAAYADRMEELARLAEAARLAAQDALDAAEAIRVQLAADLAAAEAARIAAEAARLAAETRIDDLEQLFADIADILADSALTDAQKDAAIDLLLAGDILADLLAEYDALIAAYPALEAEVLRLTTLVDTLTDALDAQQLVVDKLNIALTDAIAAELTAQATATAARLAATAKQAEAIAKRALADAAKADAEAKLASALLLEAAIQAARNLTLNASDTVGKPEAPLSVTVGGLLDAAAPNGVYIAGIGNLVISDIVTDTEAVIFSTGDLTSDGTLISVPSIDLGSLTGDVGKPGNPIDLNVDKLSGYAKKGFYVRNRKSVEIGSIQAETVDLDVNGNVTAAPGTTPNIIAEKLDLDATGNVGTVTDPLRLAVDDLTVKANDIYLHLVTDTTITEIIGKDVVIKGDANIWANDNRPGGNGYHIRAENLDIEAFGDIGKRPVPMWVYVPGTLIAKSIDGFVYLINGWPEPERPDPPGPIPGPGPGPNPIPYYRRPTPVVGEEEVVEEDAVVVPDPVVVRPNPYPRPDPIDPDPIPLVESWALMNLILTLLSILLALLLLFRRKRENESDSELERWRARDSRRKATTFGLISLALAIVAIVVFVLTQNMNNPLALLDGYSILHVIIVLVQIVLIIAATARATNTSGGSDGTPPNTPRLYPS